MGTSRGRRGGRREVYDITGARRSVHEDVQARTRRYLLSMGIRTACFVGAVLSSGVTRWSLMVGAILLPYVSVVFANGGRESARDMPAPAPVPRPALEPPDPRTHGAV